MLEVNYVGGRRYQYYGAGELPRWMTQVNCLGELRWRAVQVNYEAELSRWIPRCTVVSCCGSSSLLFVVVCCCLLIFVVLCCCLLFFVVVCCYR